MTTLTRDHLLDGTFRSRMPSGSLLTDEQLEYSIAEMLASRPDGPLWVFAYGSLIWNPLLTFDARKTAILTGWRRSFCVRSVSVRGSEEWPGRVLGLERGGQVQGVAFLLRDDHVDTELRMLWSREMASGVYHPTWTRVALDDGQEVAAIAFVANVDHSHFESDTCVSTVSKLAARATGAFGSNAEYIRSLGKALSDHGLKDPYVDEIIRCLNQVGEVIPNSSSDDGDLR